MLVYGCRAGKGLTARPLPYRLRHVYKAGPEMTAEKLAAIKARLEKPTPEPFRQMLLDLVEAVEEAQGLKPAAKPEREKFRKHESQKSE